MELSVPLGKTLEVVTARSLLLEAGDAEPGGLLVLTATGVRRDGVLEDLAAGGCCAQLRGPSQVADKGDLGHGPRRRAAEGTGESWGSNGATGEERHLVQPFLCVWAQSIKEAAMGA